MKKLIITQEQAQAIINTLLEVPAKLSFNSIDILRSLPILEEKEEAVKAVKAVK